MHSSSAGSPARPSWRSRDCHRRGELRHRPRDGGGLGPIDHLVLTAVADELFSRAKISALTQDQVERTFDKLRGYVNIVRAADVRGSLTLLTGASAVKPPREGFSVLAAASASI